MAQESVPKPFNNSIRTEVYAGCVRGRKRSERESKYGAGKAQVQKYVSPFRLTQRYENHSGSLWEALVSVRIVSDTDIGEKRRSSKLLGSRYDQRCSFISSNPTFKDVRSRVHLP